MKGRLYLLLILLLFNCESKKEREYYKITGFTQGTTYSIIYFDIQTRDFSTQIDSILRKIDESLSIYNPSSNISRINRNDIVEADSLLIKNISISRKIWEQTDGAFDITVGPITNALGFGAKKGHVIDTSEILKLLPLVGMDKVKLDGNRVVKKHAEMMIDVNAIAQGYTVDLIGWFFESENVQDYMVEVGGEVRSKGVNNRNESWVIGLDKPIENNLPGENLQIKIKLSGKGLATSGNYRKFYVENGIKYSHTINPKTGFTARNNLLSATVVAKDATHADSYATALMVMGLDQSKTFLAKHPEIDAYLIYSGPKGEYLVWMTEGFKQMILE